MTTSGGPSTSTADRNVAEPLPAQACQDGLGGLAARAGPDRRVGRPLAPAAGAGSGGSAEPPGRGQAAGASKTAVSRGSGRATKLLVRGYFRPSGRPGGTPGTASGVQAGSPPFMPLTEELLLRSGLRASVADGDSTDPGSRVTAQEPAAASPVPRDAAVGRGAHAASRSPT